MNFKIFSLIVLLFLYGCTLYGNLEEYQKWHKSGIDTRLQIRTMKYCGYPNEREIGDKKPEEIAEIHMCMVRYGYFYKTLNGHYCADNYHLPACIEAREQGYIN